MSGFATSYNTSFYNPCQQRRVSLLKPAETQHSLDKANNVLGWEGGR